MNAPLCCNLHIIWQAGKPYPKHSSDCPLKTQPSNQTSTKVPGQ